MTCPICQREAAEKFRPFCSKRCSEVDLGRWLTGAYAVAATELEQDDTSSQGDDSPTATRPN